MYVNTQLYYDFRSCMFTHIYTLLIEKASVIVESHQLSFGVFICAFHLRSLPVWLFLHFIWDLFVLSLRFSYLWITYVWDIQFNSYKVQIYLLTEQNPCEVHLLSCWLYLKNSFSSSPIFPSTLTFENVYFYFIF